MTTDGRVAAQLETQCRAAWAADVRVTGVTAIPEGHSGFSYFVDLENAPYQRAVLRLPPPGAQPKGPADVARQGRIMRAVGAHGVPVPAVPLIVDGPESLIDGRPFVLMAAVDGVRADAAAARHDGALLAESALAAMRAVHAVPVGATGIGDEPPVALDAELARWTRLIERAPTELVQGSDTLAAALESTMPVGRPPTLVHGDYTFGNLLFRDAGVVAVLDWEIAQIGDPLMDLGSLCVIAKRHDFPNDPNPSGAIKADVPWLIEHYGEPESPVEWFVALSYFKYAAIVGYNTMLHRRGKRVDPIYDVMPDTVVGLIAAALELVA